MCDYCIYKLYKELHCEKISPFVNRYADDLEFGA